MLNISDLKDKLEGVGLKIRSLQSRSDISRKTADFLVEADLDGRKIDLFIAVEERPHLPDLRLAATSLKRLAGQNALPVIAAHFIGPNRRALLKEMGVGYLDMAGNIYLRAPGILVEREEKVNPFGYERDGLNPFADKASIIMRILLNAPNKSWKIREISRAGNISPGWVSRVVESLVERGSVEHNGQNGLTLLNGEDVLKEWADIYDWHRNKFYYYYCYAPDNQAVLNKISEIKPDKKDLFALGFQAGAYLVSPYATFNQVHLIIDGGSFDTVRPEIERQLKLEPRREGANLILVRPYYKHSALFGARKIRDWDVVSDVQLYLDLNKYPIRGKEQSDHLLEKIIRPGLKK